MGDGNSSSCQGNKSMSDGYISMSDGNISKVGGRMPTFDALAPRDAAVASVQGDRAWITASASTWTGLAERPNSSLDR